MGVPERLLAVIPLFSTLTAQEKVALASQMQRTEYQPGDVIAKVGAILHALMVVSSGVLVVSTVQNDHEIEIVRLATGIISARLDCWPASN